MSSSRTSNPDAQPEATGHLSSHRVLQFVGPDAASFLQGYLTCDTATLSEQNAIPGAFTNLKGRVVANGWVWGTATEVEMLVSADLTEAVGEFLKMFLNFAKTTLTVAALPPEICLTSTPGDKVLLGAGKALLSTGFTESSSPTVAPADLSAGWLRQAIHQQEVLVTAPTSGTLLPQMLGLTELGAVSFDKGCYLGQEVVARAQHRGVVKRRLRRVAFQSEQALPAGATLEDANGKRVAVVINATASPTANQALIVTAVDELDGLLWTYADTPVQLA